MWSRHIPPDQVHVVTVPHQSSGSLLWTRFAAAMDIDPGGCDVARGRRNSSLGYAETEFLRRMNEALPADLPDWQRRPYRSARQRASDIKWAILNGPEVRRVLRRASQRTAVRRLRVLIWRVLIRPGRRGRDSPAGMAQDAAR